MNSSEILRLCRIGLLVVIACGIWYLVLSGIWSAIDYIFPK